MVWCSSFTCTRYIQYMLLALFMIGGSQWWQVFSFQLRAFFFLFGDAIRKWVFFTLRAFIWAAGGRVGYGVWYAKKNIHYRYRYQSNGNNTLKCLEDELAGLRRNKIWDQSLELYFAKNPKIYWSFIEVKWICATIFGIRQMNGSKKQ